MRHQPRTWRHVVDRTGVTLERFASPIWNGLNRGLEKLGVRRPTSRRDSISLVLSIVLHIVVLAYLAQMVAPTYHLPEPPIVEQPAPVEIEILPRPPEPLPPLPKPEPVVVQEPIPQVPTPPKPEPAPPQPAPPAESPAPPQPKPPTPEPPKPAPPKPSFLPSQVQQTAQQPRNTQIKLAPAPTQNPRLQAAPTVNVTAEPPTPTPGPPLPSPNASVSPSQLNIHVPATPAPASVAASPFRPSGGAPGKPGSAPAGGAPTAGAGTPGGAPGNGLRPYPYGVMPSGGSGLRGTLVGCANADAVGLSATERNRCNERFGSNVTQAPVLDPISREKRGQFDRAAARNAADRAYRGSVPNGNPGPHSPERTGGLGTVPSVRDK